MVNKQPKALRLADLIDANLAGAGDVEISAELRRLHAENEDFRATIDYLTRENAEQIGEIVALKEQRDELLEALKDCVEDSAQAVADYIDKYGEGFRPSTLSRMRDVVTKARTAIAKAGGAA